MFRRLGFSRGSEVCALTVGSATLGSSRREKHCVVGIDLGSTNTRIVQGQPNVHGRRLEAEAMPPHIIKVPSVVGFDGDKKLVGVAALEQQPIHPTSTFHHFKRLMGRRLGEKGATQQDSQRVPYKVVQREGAEDAWVEDAPSGKQYSPSLISASVLEAAKEAAEKYVGCEVKGAVLTCPAYFNDAQRLATRDAGKLAGLNVLRVINEPTAAALASDMYEDLYTFNDEGVKSIAVFDLGGTFDITILEFDGGVFEVKACNGDLDLGGQDFDRVLQQHIQGEFRKSTGVDLSQNPMALQRVWEAAEKAKCELSTAPQAEINLPSLSPGHDARMTITRPQFETLAAALIQRTIAPCQKCLQDAKVNVKDIDEVLLVGGMCQMPKVMEAVKDIFGKAPLRSETPPEDLVAIGAAIQAEVVGNWTHAPVQLLEYTDATLSLQAEGGTAVPIIDKGTIMGKWKQVLVTTTEDNQESLTIRVLLGQSERAADNILLGTIEVGKIDPVPKGVPRIQVLFNMDPFGKTFISAKAGYESHDDSMSFSAIATAAADAGKEGLAVDYLAASREGRLLTVKLNGGMKKRELRSFLRDGTIPERLQQPTTAGDAALLGGYLSVVEVIENNDPPNEQQNKKGKVPTLEDVTYYILALTIMIVMFDAECLRDVGRFWYTSVEGWLPAGLQGLTEEPPHLQDEEMEKDER